MTVASSSSKPDTPGDALVGLEGELAKAAKSLHVDDGNQNVTGAFALGWQIAEVFNPERRRQLKASGDELSELIGMDEEARLSILFNQIDVHLKRLNVLIEQAGLPMIVNTLRTCTDAKAREDAVKKLHRDLLSTLTATDFKLGKGYGLGRALADLSRNSSGDLRKELLDPHVALLRGRLDDLSSAFPAHASHSVERSLAAWVAWASGLPPAARASADELDSMRRQGELWRSLLSGEKRGTEMLERRHYIDAAKQLAVEMRKVLRGVLASFWVVLVVVAVLFAGGVALIVWAGPKGLVGGATSILVALGLSWRTLGGTAGRLLGKLEQPLYDALLDAAITDAITLTKGEVKVPHRDRRLLALEMTRPRESQSPEDGGKPGGAER